jgi:RimJ/RimL family protein N-acetyltransferase
MLINDKNLVLKNDIVTLRFPVLDDSEELKEILSDAEIWNYTISKITTEEELDGYFEDASAGISKGTKYTFVIIDNSTGRLAGTSSYGNISEADCRLEIGWSYLGKDFRGKGINGNFKFLMLQYAFETLGMKRVEFKTDFLNARARKALLKIGCTEEGVLRSHSLLHTGRRRDSIYYSILDSEWDNVKKKFHS